MVANCKVEIGFLFKITIFSLCTLKQVHSTLHVK